MTDRATAFICFCIANLIDARVTQHMISLGIFEEANPLMLMSMNNIPSGMWISKIAISLFLLLAWKRMSLNFLIALDAGMCAVVGWNVMLLSVWYTSQFVSLEAIGC